MKSKKVLTISILPIMWLMYVLFELISGRISDIKTLLFNLILIILFGLVGLIIYNFSIKFRSGLNKKFILISFSLFFVLDQGIKIIIKLFFFTKHIEIIPNMLFFSPIINTDGSWLNARFGTSVSFPLLIAINIAAIFLFIEIYRYYIFKGNNDYWADMCFIFVTCGALCSLIDKIFYGGSLDFIGISTLFIADIKDLYINLGILFFILTLFNNGYLTSSEETSFKDDINNLKNFITFISHDIKNKFKTL